MDKKPDKSPRASAEFSRNLIASMSDGVSVLDKNGVHRDVNPSLCRMTGFSREELIGTGMPHLYCLPEEYEHIQAALQQTLTGNFRDCELTFRRKNGEHFPVIMSSFAVKDNRGNIVGYSATVKDITERLSAEQAGKRAGWELMNSETRYRDMVENIGAWMWETDAEGRYAQTSQGVENMLGYLPEEILQKPFFDFLHPDDRESIKAGVLAFFAAKDQFHDLISRIMHKNGQTRWLSTSGRPMLDDKGDLLGYRGLSTDITKQKQTEVEREQLIQKLETAQAETKRLLTMSEQSRRALLSVVEDERESMTALRRSEAEFKNLFESANDAIIIFEPVDEIIREANIAACKTYGYLRKELVGKSMRELSKDVAESERQIQNLLTEGALHSFETVHLRSDGTPINIEVSASVTEYGGQKVIQSINRDITDWKRVQNRLRQLSTAVEQSPASIIITDTKGNVEYANPRFEQLTGYSLNEVIGKNPRLLKSGETPPEEYSRLWATITAGGEWRGEFHNKKKNGELYWELATISPIRDGSGAITHFLAVKEDTTEFKSLEQQLRQAQKLESIGTLAGGIAHDFNNILGIIVGHAGLLRRVGSDPVRLASSVDAIHTAVHRGAGLVRQILTFARKTDILFEPTLMNEIVSEMVLIMGETFPKTITVETRLEPDLPVIHVDRTQIHQTLLNLCVNARDAMPNGGTFSLTTTRVAANSLPGKFSHVKAAEYICVSASDTGTGMDETTMQHLFEPFFTTKEKGKGTGLGLAVVYGIMQSHHGFIDVESAIGKGTTFRMYFPILQRGVEPAAMTEAKPEETPGGNETLLIIEDEVMLRELLRSTLDAKGYKVLTANDGEQGLTLYRKHRQEIGLVLTDFGLPKMNGGTLFEKMKKLNPKVKVIIASGYMDPEAKSKLFAAGAKAFLQKPFSMTEVMNCVREEIDRRNE